MLSCRVLRAAQSRSSGAAAAMRVRPAGQLTRTSLMATAAVAPTMLSTMSSRPASCVASLRTPARAYTGQVLLSNLAAHSTQLSACTSLTTMLYSPLGTAMLLVLAYNVVVVVSKNVNYVLELTAKDYVQDQQLYVIMRYGILACILLGMEVMFIEV